MHSPESVVFSLFVVIAIVGTLTIWLGLRTRNAIQQEALNLTGSALLRKYPEINHSNFLYALRQDFSNTVNGFLVRDAQDNEVAKICFYPIRRDDFIEIEMGNKRYTCDSLPTWWTNIILKEGKDKQPLCTCRKKIISLFYSTEEAQCFQINKTLHAIVTDRYKIKSNNAVIGELRPINEGALQKGVILDIRPSVPLPVRLFFLATL